MRSDPEKCPKCGLHRFRCRCDRQELVNDHLAQRTAVRLTKARMDEIHAQTEQAKGAEAAEAYKFQRRCEAGDPAPFEAEPEACPKCGINLAVCYCHVPGGLECQLAQAKAENARLAGIVDRLPKTADGVPVVPGMPVYYRFLGPDVVEQWVDDQLTIHADRRPPICQRWCWYSTREAATSAKGKP